MTTILSHKEIQERIERLDHQIARLEATMQIHRTGSSIWLRAKAAKKRLKEDIAHLKAMLKDVPGKDPL